MKTVNDDAQLDALMEQLTVEKAPASLTRRLKRIPREAGQSGQPLVLVKSPAIPAMGHGAGIRRHSVAGMWR